MTEHGYTVIYEALSEGGYQVLVPALPASLLSAGVLTRRARWRAMRSSATSAVC